MKVVLPPQSTVGKVESALWKAYLQNPAPSNDDLTIDMSGCEYIEIAAMLYLNSVMAGQAVKNAPIELILPKQKQVRDIFRVWRFPQAVSRATGVEFASVVRKEDLQYFGENDGATESKYRTKIDDPGLALLEEANFFSIATFTPSGTSRTRLVTEESRRWESELIKTVLCKHLDGPESYLASRIVYEAMTNAFRHPGATMVQAASKFNAPREEATDSRGHFTICFWDDGKSMVDTLLDAMKAGKPIRSKSTPDLYSDHVLILKNAAGEKIKIYTISSKTEPTLTSPEHEILFATTYPGISRDATGKEHVAHDSLKTEDPRLSLPGMGLHLLLNAVIDIFNGSIAFRTKTFFMNVRAAEKPAEAKYRAKIQAIDHKRIPAFRGNLVTIRIPLKKGAAVR